ncbi:MULTISPECIES: hypothetical protein [unclassified Aminobacter]|uniref:hypothetical protein n=1 Tax=unclassified Aminobacter TaxID=2644704 RepID=UPI000464C610|nr:MULTISPECIES: hypothetical protein [unclassified Aminobacter]
MKVIAYRLMPAGGTTRARVDVETPWGIRLFNVALKQTDRGWRAFGPSSFGSAAVTFTPDIAAQIIDAALAVIGEMNLDQQRAA